MGLLYFALGFALIRLVRYDSFDAFGLRPKVPRVMHSWSRDQPWAR